MKKITMLTGDPRQSVKVGLDDGSKVSLDLWYSEMQQGWFYDLTRDEFSLQGRRLVVSPNMVRQFKEIVPFGLACFSTDGYEPVFIDDFTSGRVSVYVLDEDDVETAEQGIAAYA